MKKSMQVSQLIEFLKEQKDLKVNEINESKCHIHSDYYMAKYDFRCIENMTDVYETLDYMIDKLQDCQDRIIERNKIDISML